MGSAGTGAARRTGGRLLAGVVLAGAFALMLLASGAHPAAPATITETQSVPFDRMGDVAETPPDPWQVPQSDGSLAPDATSLHVGLAAANPITNDQSDLARSFVHVALDRLPAGSL